jgi:hypothetical protein
MSLPIILDFPTQGIVLTRSESVTVNLPSLDWVRQLLTANDKIMRESTVERFSILNTSTHPFEQAMVTKA